MGRYDELRQSVENLRTACLDEAASTYSANSEATLKKIAEVCLEIIIEAETHPDDSVAADETLRMQHSNQAATIRKQQDIMLRHFMECGMTCEDDLVQESVALAFKETEKLS